MSSVLHFLFKTPSSHLAEDDLIAFTEGETARHAKKNAERHLAACLACLRFDPDVDILSSTGPRASARQVRLLEEIDVAFRAALPAAAGPPTALFQVGRK